MTAVQMLPLPDTLTSLVMLVFNTILAGLVLVLTARLADRLSPKPGVWLLAALVTLVLIVDLARWTTIGLEVPLQTAVFLWLLIRVLDEAAVNRARPIIFFLAGILGIIRVDGPLLALILCLIAFGLQADKKRVQAYTILVSVLPLAHILFRLAYYGKPLPNTYYLKLAAWNSRLAPGWRYLARFVQLYWPLLAANSSWMRPFSNIMGLPCCISMMCRYLFILDRRPGRHFWSKVIVNLLPMRSFLNLDLRRSAG